MKKLYNWMARTFAMLLALTMGAALQPVVAQDDGPEPGYYFINSAEHPEDGLLYLETHLYPQGERVRREVHSIPGKLTAADKPFVFEVRKTDTGGYTLKSYASGMYMGRIATMGEGGGLCWVSDPTEFKIGPSAAMEDSYYINNENTGLSSGGYVQWQGEYRGEKVVGYWGTDAGPGQSWLFEKIDDSALDDIEEITEVEGSLDEGYYYVNFPYTADASTSLVPASEDQTNWRLGTYVRSDDDTEPAYIWHITKNADGTYNFKNCGTQPTTYIRVFTKGSKASPYIVMTGTEPAKIKLQFLSNGCAYIYSTDNDNNFSVNGETGYMQTLSDHNAFSMAKFSAVPADRITNSLKLREAITDAQGHFFAVGENPGNVAQADYDTFDAVLQKAVAAETSEADNSALITELQEATAALVAKQLPIEDGYYTFRNCLNTESYLYPHYGNHGNGLGWYLYNGMVDPTTDYSAIWHVKKTADGKFVLKSCGTQDSTYVVSGSSDYNWGRVRMAGASKTTQSFVNEYGNRFRIYSSDNNLFWNSDGPDAIVSSNNDYHPNDGAWEIIKVEADYIPFMSNLNEAITDAAGTIKDSQVGPNPGDNQGDPSALNAAIEEARTMYDEASASDDEVNAAIAKLTDETTKFNEQDHSMRQIEDGYYNILNTETAYQRPAGVAVGEHIAMYVPTSNELNWTPLISNDGRFLFQITNLGDGTFSVKNIQSGRFIGSYNGSVVTTTSGQEVAQKFAYINNGIWNASNTANDGTYTLFTYGTETSGAIVINTGYTHNQWMLRKVTDQALIDSLVNSSSQVQINEAMNAALAQAEPAYKAVFKYDVDLTDGLIKEVDEKNPRNGQIVGTQEPSATNTENVSANYSAYQFLIDGNLGSCFQSTWNTGVWDAGGDRAPSVGTDNPQWLQVDLRNNPVDNFEFLFGLRAGDWGWKECWTDIDIYGTNSEALAGEDATDLAQWSHIGKFTDLTSYMRPKDASMNSDNRNIYYPVTGVDQKYRYLRFCVNNTIVPQANMMYTIGEFQVYALTANETNSPYNYVEGLKALVDELKTQIDNGKAKVANNTVTMDEVNAITELTAKVVALTPDVEPINNRISEVRAYIEKFSDNDEWGDTSTDENTAINNAVDDADSYDHEQPTAADLNARLAALNTAFDLYKSQQKKPETNVWYYIVNTDQERPGYDADGDGGTSSSIWSRFCVGNIVIAPHSNNTRDIVWSDPRDAISWAGFDHVSATRADSIVNDPYSMWRLVKIEGNDTPDTYALQNRANGHYMGVSANHNGRFGMSSTPVPYTIVLLKSGEMNIICADASNTNKYGIHASGDRYLVSWEGGADTPSSWNLEPVADDVDHLEMTIAPNNAKIIALPYAYDDNAASLNEANGVETYAVKGLSEDGSRLELYKKNEFAAGEPMVVVSSADADKLYLPLANDYNYESKAANGLVGVFNYTQAPANAGIIAGDSVRTTGNNGAFLCGLNGYIDAGQIVNDASKETALSLKIEGIINSIANAKVNGNAAKVNVYTTDGVLVKKNAKAADATKGLKKGIYIIGKDKVLVK